MCGSVCPRVLVRKSKTGQPNSHCAVLELQNVPGVPRLKGLHRDRVFSRTQLRSSLTTIIISSINELAQFTPTSTELVDRSTIVALLGVTVHKFWLKICQ